MVFVVENPCQKQLGRPQFLFLFGSLLVSIIRLIKTTYPC